MKKTIQNIAMLTLATSLFIACEKDDTDFSDYINGTVSTVNTISIVYNGTSVTVTGDTNDYVTTNGADVVVNTSTATDSLLLMLLFSSKLPFLT